MARSTGQSWSCRIDAWHCRLTPPPPCTWRVQPCSFHQKHTPCIATVKTSRRVSQLKGVGNGTGPASDLYSLLGVSTTADTAQLKSAYRQQVLTCHPDFYQDQPEKQQEAAERLRALNHAYELLSDDMQRQAYDQNLRVMQATEAAVAAAEESPDKLTCEEIKALRDAMERAQLAMQEAVRARQKARDALRMRKAQVKARSAKPQHTSTASDSTTQEALRQAAPQETKAAARAARAAKQKHRQELRQARREERQYRGWAQYAEAQAAGMQQAVAQQLSSISDDDDDEYLGEGGSERGSERLSDLDDWLMWDGGSVINSGSDTRNRTALKSGKTNRKKQLRPQSFIWPGEESG